MVQDNTDLCVCPISDTKYNGEHISVAIAAGWVCVHVNATGACIRDCRVFGVNDWGGGTTYRSSRSKCYVNIATNFNTTYI